MQPTIELLTGEIEALYDQLAGANEDEHIEILLAISSHQITLTFCRLVYWLDKS